MRVTPKEGYAGLSGHTLVIAGCGGLAHLGELAVDALVSSFQLKRVAIVETSNLLPVVMASAWAPPGGGKEGELELTTTAEVYQAANVPRLSVLQLRAPPADGRRGALAEELWAWACQEGAAEVVLVSACSSHVKVDADFAASTELRSLQVRGTGEKPAAPGLGQDFLPLGHSLSEEELEGADCDIFALQRLLRGSGLARSLLLKAAEQREQPASEARSGPNALCLLGMTGEILDGRVLEQLSLAVCGCIASRLADTQTPNLRPPPSWHYQMQSAPSPQWLWG